MVCHSVSLNPRIFFNAYVWHTDLEKGVVLPADFVYIRPTMVKIRLTRRGMKKAPQYRVVVADSRNQRDGRFIEILGHFDPKEPQAVGTIDKERFDYWVSQGAQPSESVARLIRRMEKSQTASA